MYLNNECYCGQNNIDSENNTEPKNYMFFNNLQTIKRNIDQLLNMDRNTLDLTLSQDHDWAADHIATAKDDIQEVTDFFINNSNSRINQPTVFVKTFESFILTL